MLIKFIYILKFHTKQNINFSFKKHEDVGTKHVNESKAFIEYLNDMNKIQSKYNPNKEGQTLTAFDDMLSNKKRNPKVTELFLDAEN